MSDFGVEFGRPFFLFLFAVLPIFWFVSRISFAALGSWQRTMALALRVSIVALLVAALAEIQWMQPHDETAVFFVLDQSDSLSQAQREGSFQFAKNLQLRYQNTGRGDTTGIIVFGKQASLEQPLQSEMLATKTREAMVDGGGSNLAEALRLAGSSFVHPGRKRIVLVSDGNENAGEVVAEASRLARQGVAIDVAVVPHPVTDDVLVERVETPHLARLDSPFDVSVVVQRRTMHPTGIETPANGRLIVIRKSGSESVTVADQTVQLESGHNLFRFREADLEAGFFTYTATFIPDKGVPDAFRQNNVASGFTQITSGGRVLLIVAEGREDEFVTIADSLRHNEMEVIVRSDYAPFVGLVELQSFDVVIMADIPRISSGMLPTEARFQDSQLEMLVKNIERFGAGMIMLGGPNSFGVGGWSNTALEKAMPVDFQVRNRKVVAVGALALVIDKSGSMSGEKILMSKAAAKAAVGMLGDNDYIGVYAFDSNAETIVPMQPIGSLRNNIKRRVSEIAIGGGTDMAPALVRAYRDLENSTAAAKHLIVLTDGLTSGSGYVEMAAQMRASGITTSSVSIGTDAAHALLQSMATRGGGNYYQPASPKALPAIFMKETRVVLRPLIFEDPSGVNVQTSQLHDILQGIERSLPAISGYVLTTKKENPLVETLLTADRPESPHNTILATWQYGLGRSVVWTTDTGQRWAKQWVNWPAYERLLVQTVRWAMRPMNGSENSQLFTELKNGKLRVIVHAIDGSGGFQNGLDVTGDLVSLDMKANASLAFKQVAPGRYLGETELVDPGDYLLSVVPGAASRSIMRAGVSFHDSHEYRISGSNSELLERVANQSNNPAADGQLANGLHRTNSLLKLPDDSNAWGKIDWIDIYRPTSTVASSIQNAWPLCVFAAATLFFFDVANRRLAWPSVLQSLAEKGRHQPPPKNVPISNRLRQLRSAKEHASLSQAEGGLLVSDVASPHEVRPDVHAPGMAVPPTAKLPMDSQSGLGYADRLLRAKREAQEKARRTKGGSVG